MFVVTDIFGNKFYSGNALLEMTKTIEELKQNPLPDGEYAAEVELILEDYIN